MAHDCMEPEDSGGEMGKPEVGFTCGSFDLAHAGHLMMFEECKDHCDYLIVGLAANTFGRPGKNEPVESLFERYMRLRACKWIDEIIVYDNEKDLGNILWFLYEKHGSSLIRFLDVNYQETNFNFKELPIRTYFNSRHHDFSSSGLRERIIAQNTKRPKR